jgi:hypothetical protein
VPLLRPVPAELLAPLLLLAGCPGELPGLKGAACFVMNGVMGASEGSTGLSRCSAASDAACAWGPPAAAGPPARSRPSGERMAAAVVPPRCHSLFMRYGSIWEGHTLRMTRKVLDLNVVLAAHRSPTAPVRM